MAAGALSRWLVPVAVLLAIPAAAAAQAPVDLGPGHTPHVSMVAFRTAVVTFQDTATGVDSTTRYCRLPAGVTACTPPAAFTYAAGSEEGLDLGHWPLVPGDGRVLVFDQRCCQGRPKYVYTSGDGGVTFGPRVQVGDLGGNGSGSDGAALYAPPGSVGRPAESILTLTSQATAGQFFQATGTTGPPDTAFDVISQGVDTSGSLALAGNTLVAAWIHLEDGLAYWRQWSGSGDVNDDASWLPITAVDSLPQTGVARLVGGAGGIYLAISNPQGLTVRRFTGSGWGPPVQVVGTEVFRWDVAMDPSGLVHFVWDEGGALRYRYGSPDDGPLTAPTTLVDSGRFEGVELAVEGPRSGWVVWADGSPAQTRALELEPLPQPRQGVAVNAVPTRGQVLVKLRGRGRFVPLESLGQQVPVGSTFDTKKGTVRLFTAITKSGERTQSGTFRGGQFRVEQSRKNPLTTLRMSEGITACRRRPPRGGAPKAVASRSRRRSVFGNARGRFRTRGRHSTATVRGTRWSMSDTCSSTITRVQSGRVVVRDLVKRRTRILRAGQRYIARR